MRLVVCRALGGALMALAVALWLFAPSVESDAPFKLLFLPTPGTLFQVARWLVIASIGALGWVIWEKGRHADKGASPRGP